MAEQVQALTAIDAAQATVLAQLQVANEQLVEALQALNRQILMEQMADRSGFAEAARRMRRR